MDKSAFIGSIQVFADTFYNTSIHISTSRKWDYRSQSKFLSDVTETSCDDGSQERRPCLGCSGLATHFPRAEQSSCIAWGDDRVARDERGE